MPSALSTPAMLTEKILESLIFISPDGALITAASAQDTNRRMKRRLKSPFWWIFIILSPKKAPFPGGPEDRSGGESPAPGGPPHDCLQS